MVIIYYPPVTSPTPRKNIVFIPGQRSGPYWTVCPAHLVYWYIRDTSKAAVKEDKKPFGFN